MRLAWLVFDDERTVSEIADDLIPTLPDLYFSLGVEAIGPEHWRPETDAYGQSWLVLDVDTRPWTDPVRARARRSTTP